MLHFIYRMVSGWINVRKAYDYADHMWLGEMFRFTDFKNRLEEWYTFWALDEIHG